MFFFACSSRKGSVVMEDGGSKSQCGQSDEKRSCVEAFIFSIVACVNLRSQRSSGWVLAFVQVAVVAVLSAAITPVIPAAPLANGTRLGGFEGLPGLLLRPEVWVPLLYLGLLGTTLAFYLMSTLQRHLGATDAAVIYSLEPVFAALLAMTGWIPGIHEHLRGTQILGGAVILGAMLMAELAPPGFGLRRKDQST